MRPLYFYGRGNPTITWYNPAYFSLFLPSFVVNSKDLRHALFTVRCRFPRSNNCNLLHFHFNIFISQMCISIQSNTDLTMLHNILKCFEIHSRPCHIRTECMSANMRSYIRHLYPVNLVVLLPDMLKILLPVKRYHRSAVLIQEQESRPFQVLYKQIQLI